MPFCFFPRLKQPCLNHLRAPSLFAFNHLPPSSRSAIPFFVPRGERCVLVPDTRPHFKFRSFLPRAPTLVPFRSVNPHRSLIAIEPGPSATWKGDSLTVHAIFHSL
jgi:hypothetical protein